MFPRFLAMLLLVWAASTAVYGQEADQPDDDTKLVLAMAQLGAQMELREGRIIELQLAGEAIDDGVLKKLKTARFLQSLTIVAGKITGQGLAHVSDLRALHTLRIEDTPLVDRDVPELVGLKSVNSYILRGTNISGMGKQRMEALLKKAKRDAAIAFHRGGFFGVAGPIGGQTCVISSVVPDSAAAAADIQIGDVIVEFDGREIATFQDLADTVGLTPPQQPVLVVVQRGDNKLTKTVKLTRGQPAVLR